MTSSSPPRADPPARPAATVILARDTVVGESPGIEVFVLRRSAGAAFAAGMYVFPGGGVDDRDSAAAMAPFCAGLDDAAASTALGLDRGGLAYWVAAIRECFEEAGILLAHRRDGGPLVLDAGERRAVHSGDLSMEQLCRRHDLVLDLAAIRYVAHWVTPIGEAPGETRRFDTRFFLAAAPEGQTGVHDEAELVHSMWVRPAQAIAMAQAGDLMMLPPTLANLHALVPSPSVAAALAAADAAGPPERIEPRLRHDGSGRIVGIALPGDADYADWG